MCLCEMAVRRICIVTVEDPDVGLSQMMCLKCIFCLNCLTHLNSEAASPGRGTQAHWWKCDLCCIAFFLSFFFFHLRIYWTCLPLELWSLFKGTRSQKKTLPPSLSLKGPVHTISSFWMRFCGCILKHLSAILMHFLMCSSEFFSLFFLCVHRMCILMHFYVFLVHPGAFLCVFGAFWCIF